MRSGLNSREVFHLKQGGLAGERGQLTLRPAASLKTDSSREVSQSSASSYPARFWKKRWVTFSYVLWELPRRGSWSRLMEGWVKKPGDQE